MNGKWLAESEIPADRSGDGAFNFLRVKAEEEVFNIIQELSKHQHPVGSNAQKIGDMYKSFMESIKIKNDRLLIKNIDKEIAINMNSTELKIFNNIDYVFQCVLIYLIIVLPLY